MSLLLAFDTATPDGSVALGRAGELLAERRIGSSVRHAESLLPAIAEVLAGAGHRAADLDGVVVGEGPGSFTGVRIAAATARGMVRALGIPLHAYGSLLAEAAAAGRTDGPVCALFDARREEVYAACYAFAEDGWRTLMEPVALDLTQALARAAGFVPLWAGEGARRHASDLPSEPLEPTMSRAAALLRLAATAPAAGLHARPSAWEPNYLRPPGAERLRR